MSSEAPDLGTTSWYDRSITGYSGPMSMSTRLMGMALGGGRGRGARAVDNELRMHALKQSISSAHDIATHAGKSDIDTDALKQRGEMLQQQSMDFHKNSIDDKMSHWSKMYEEARGLPEGHPEKEARLKALSNIDQFVHAPGGFSVSGLGSVDSGKPSLSYNVGRKADDAIKLSGDPYTPPTPPAAPTGPIPPTPPSGGTGPIPPVPPSGGGPTPPKPPTPPIPPTPPKPPTGGGPSPTVDDAPSIEDSKKRLDEFEASHEREAQARDVTDWERTRRNEDFVDTARNGGIRDKDGTKFDLDAVRKHGITFEPTPQGSPFTEAPTTVIPTVKPGSPPPAGTPPTGEVPDRARRRGRRGERG